MDNSLLSPELRAELGQGDIVITKKRKKVPNAKKGPKPQAPSKARVKKMQKIKERKMNKLRQREYLDTIQKESVPAVSRTLLHSTCNMGQKATLRERLMREHLEKKAGIFTGKDEFIHNPIQHMHQLHTVTPDMTIEEVNEYQTQKQAQALVARKKKRSRATDFFHNQDDALVEMQKQSNKNKKNEKTDEKTKSVVVSNDKASSTPLQPAKRIVKMKVNILQKPTSEEDSNPPAANPYKISFKVGTTRERAVKKRKILVGLPLTTSSTDQVSAVIPVSSSVNNSGSSGSSLLAKSRSSKDDSDWRTITGPKPLAATPNVDWRTVKEPAESCIEPQVLTGVEPNLDNPDNFHDEGSNSEDMDIEKSENEANEEFADVEMQYDDDDDDDEEEEEEEEEEDDEEDDDEEEEDEGSEEEDMIEEILSFGRKRNGDQFGMNLTNNLTIYNPNPESNERFLNNKPLELKKFIVPINRIPEMQEARLGLPILGLEQEIMEAVDSNPIIILCGETGSGKTTQMPQFLYERGYSWNEAGKPGMIGVTQPRRVAAMSTAARVASELNMSGKGESTVAHQIRYDSHVTKSTKIKFMTDGILLREIQQDFLLSKYSVLILDEAHERNLNTDVLIGLLSRIIPLRNQLAQQYTEKLDASKNSNSPDKQSNDEEGAVYPLKLIIMSATLRVEDFTGNHRLFPVPPPVMQVPSRQYPVTVHFNRVTHLTEYLPKVVAKVSKIHTTLPPGAILVFLTGSQDIQDTCRRLRLQLSNNQSFSKQTEELTEDEGEESDNEGEVVKSPGNDETENQETKESGGSGKVIVLPLYSLLPTHQQMKVFQPVPEGTRLIVVATNVAETSLTIPGVRYVVDAGREKTRVYDKTTGMSKFVVTWTSRAGARQRAGRAGRTGPGHCYRLYSSAVFNDQFEEHSKPEILRTPIEATILQMKAMNIESINTFPFPSPPDPVSLKAAMSTLLLLEALDEKLNITTLGRTLAKFPVTPRYAKMLVLGNQGNCLPYVIAVAASLSVENIFLQKPNAANSSDEEDSDEEALANFNRKKGAKKSLTRAQAERRKQQKAFAEAKFRWIDPRSDLLTRLRVIGGYQHVCSSYLKKQRKLKKKAQKHKKKFVRTSASLEETQHQFCADNFLRGKALNEIQDLRRQLTRIALDIIKKNIEAKQSDMAIGLPGEVGTEAEVEKDEANETVKFLESDQLPLPSPEQEQMLLQIITAGFVDHTARKMPEPLKQAILDPTHPMHKKLMEAAEAQQNTQSYAALGSGALKKLPTLTMASLGSAYQCLATDEPVFLHPGSVLFSEENQPDYLVYHSLVNTSKTYMKQVSMIQPTWLSTIGASLCTRSAPLSSPAPIYDSTQDKVRCFVNVTFGPPRWAIPIQQVDFPEDHPAHVRHFARLLLEGAICPVLKQFRAFLVNKPSVFSQELITLPRARNFIKALSKYNIHSRGDLEAKWASKPDFLKLEFRDWVQSSKKHLIDERWPHFRNN